MAHKCPYCGRETQKDGIYLFCADKTHAYRVLIKDVDGSKFEEDLENELENKLDFKTIQIGDVQVKYIPYPLFSQGMYIATPIAYLPDERLTNEMNRLIEAHHNDVSIEQELITYIQNKWPFDEVGGLESRMSKLREEFEELDEASILVRKYSDTGLAFKAHVENLMDECSDILAVLLHISHNYGYNSTMLMERVMCKYKVREINPNYKKNNHG